MAFSSDTDKDWELWGQKDPYYGVLTVPEFSKANLNDDSLREFFTTGERHISHVFDFIRSSLRPGFEPITALDYGCGVGRLLGPLAKRSQNVIGVDVSPTMLAEAKKNCAKQGIASARLLHVDEMGSVAPSSVDLIHSVIVFQHIPVDRGELIIKKLVALLAEGGIGAIHLTYADTRSLFLRALTAVRRHVPVVHGLLNLARHRPYSNPLMQMNNYSMNRIFQLLSDAHCSNVQVELTDLGTYRAAMVYFVKSTPAS